ncbi:MAG TPA: sulfatase [Candidatus Hydrogenedentes bacterium]|nr:sulfatase [Candidatus Hydrogenedentota bacterium]HPG69730.1 sulfatase [Candidatus Hydrogenedentota bacterium]
MAPPNILYLHSHDTGRYIQPYGHAIPTPNLQRLAETGVVFRNAFCANPTCSASRACLLTGQCAHRNGMLGLAHRGFSLYDYTRHIIHPLRKAGYVSALAGVQHIANSGDQSWRTIGYDHYLGAPDVAHEKAAEFLETPPNRPFFLSVGFVETHREYPPASSAEDPRYSLPPGPIPDTPETREDMARFKASARILDAKMGFVLDALDRTGLAENTLVVCTTDHGIAFPRMKCNLTDGGIGVMLILRGPGGFLGGKVVDALVSQIDLYPTLCDVAGMDPPAWLEGHSIIPLIRGEVDSIREAVFAEVNYHAAYEPIRAVRTRRWKYIRRYDGRTRPVLPNCDDSPSKSLWLEHEWPDKAPPEEALHDLLFDPHEAHNVAGDPACAAALADMRARLDRWMRETDDPLLDGGVVRAPAGAVVNNPDGISPQEKVVVAGLLPH